MKPEEKIKVKDFMLDNFYSNAIVPSAIKLRDTWPKFDYLNDEMDLMLDSPACVVTTNMEAQCLKITQNDTFSVVFKHRAYIVCSNKLGEVIMTSSDKSSSSN